MDNDEKGKVTKVIKDLVAAENRYKDGLSDERWTDAEMAQNKRQARENAISFLKSIDIDVKGL
jgi:hypothetical protein